MDKALNGLFRIKSFRNNYLALGIGSALLLISFCAKSQLSPYDSTKTLQAIQAYGYSWNNMKAYKTLIIPNDTPRLALRDSGATAYKGGSQWNWSGTKWVQSSQTSSSVSST